MNITELIWLLKNGMLDLSDLGQDYEMKERSYYLSKHTYSIYQGNNGAWYTYFPDDERTNGRRMVRRSSKEKLEDYIAQFYIDKEDNPTIEEVFAEWNERRVELGKIKKSTFMRNEQIFRRHFSEFGKKKIRKVSPDEFCDFLEEQISIYGLTSRAFSNLKSITRGFLKRAKKQKLIFYDVEAMLSELDVSDREFKKVVYEDSDQIFYDDEMDEIMAYCFEHRIDICCLGVALMFSGGLRVGEVVALKQSDLMEYAVSVTKTETHYLEGGKAYWDISDNPKTDAGIRTVVIPDKFLWVLEGLKSYGGKDYIFTGKNGNRLHTQAIRKRLYQICEKLHMKVRSPHKIRKTYGSILLDNGVDSKIIEKQMGHTNILCTETYYHKDRRGLSQKRAIINGVSQFE